MEYQQKWEAAEENLREAIRREPQNQEFRSALRRAMVQADQSGVDAFIKPRIELQRGMVATERYGAEDVPVMHVADARQYETITRSLASASTPHYQTFFRGQHRSWITDGEVSLAPALHRTTHAIADIERQIGEWRRLLRPFMGDLADDRSAFVMWRSHPAAPRLVVRPPGIAATGRMVNLIWQPEMGGTMQHYGFPTDFLDVTPNPKVALWFALHRTRRSSHEIEFERTSWLPHDGEADWPVVYVFKVFRRHVVDLRDGCLSQANALRIQRQHASLLTTVDYEMPVMNPLLPRRLSAMMRPQINEVRPNLILILKLQAGEGWEDSAREEPAWYFPPDDEIYESLVQADAPHVVGYRV